MCSAQAQSARRHSTNGPGIHELTSSLCYRTTQSNVTTSRCPAAFSLALSISLARSAGAAVRLLNPVVQSAANCNILLATAPATSSLVGASPLRSVGLNAR